MADASLSSSKIFDELSIRVNDTAEVDALLAEVGALLKADKTRTLVIRVHADERPGLQSNTYLALERAKRLDKEIRKRGGRKSQITHEAIGHNGIEHSRDTSVVIFDFSDDAKIKI